MKYWLGAHTGEVPDGSKKRVSHNGNYVLLTNVQGTYYAIDDRCPHMGGSLAAGVLEGDHITCPKHGSMFDVRTGKALRGAKIAFFKMNVRDVKAYAVKVEGNDILIGME